jgi:hypothetical protein
MHSFPSFSPFLFISFSSLFVFLFFLFLCFTPFFRGPSKFFRQRRASALDRIHFIMEYGSSSHSPRNLAIGVHPGHILRTYFRTGMLCMCFSSSVLMASHGVLLAPFGGKPPSHDRISAGYYCTGPNEPANQCGEREEAKQTEKEREKQKREEK